MTAGPGPAARLDAWRTINFWLRNSVTTPFNVTAAPALVQAGVPDFAAHMKLRQRMNLAFMRAVEARGALRELLGAVSPEVRDDARPGAAERRQAVAEERLDADVLEADGVQHAGRRLCHAGLHVPLAGVLGDALADDRPKALDVDERGVLGAVALAPFHADHLLHFS